MEKIHIRIAINSKALMVDIYAGRRVSPQFISIFDQLVVQRKGLFPRVVTIDNRDYLLYPFFAPMKGL